MTVLSQNEELINVLFIFSRRNGLFVLGLSYNHVLQHSTFLDSSVLDFLCSLLILSPQLRTFECDPTWNLAVLDHYVVLIYIYRSI